MSWRRLRLALRRADGAAEVLAGDDVGGVDRPELGELHAALLEVHRAVAPVRHHDVAALPGDLVVGVHAGGGVHPLDGQPPALRAAGLPSASRGGGGPGGLGHALPLLRLRPGAAGHGRRMRCRNPAVQVQVRSAGTAVPLRGDGPGGAVTREARQAGERRRPVRPPDAGRRSPSRSPRSRRTSGRRWRSAGRRLRPARGAGRGWPAPPRGWGSRRRRPRGRPPRPGGRAARARLRRPGDPGRLAARR